MKVESGRNVITIDVIGSKKEKRFNQVIREKLSNLNPASYEFAPALSRGDEIQCVVAQGENPFSVIREIRFILLPIKLKIGIGIGEIEIPSQVRDSWDLSGEAFFKARKALNDLADARETCMGLSSGHFKKDLALNSILKLMNLIINDWTSSQFTYVMEYERYETYEKASEILGVSSQNIHKACKRAHWTVIKNIENNLYKLLKEMEW